MDKESVEADKRPGNVKSARIGTLVPTEVSTNQTPVDLRDDGLLWLINRVVLHPRGFALGVNGDNTLTLLGNGDTPWHYAQAAEITDPDHLSSVVDEQAKFDAVEALFARARLSG